MNTEQQPVDGDERVGLEVEHRVGGLAEYDFHPGGGWPVGLTLGFTRALPDDDPYTGQSGTLFGLLSDKIGRKGGLMAVFAVQTLAYLLA